MQGDVAIACSTGILGVNFFIIRDQFLGKPQANIAAKPGIEFSKKIGKTFQLKCSAKNLVKNFMRESFFYEFFKYVMLEK